MGVVIIGAYGFLLSVGRKFIISAIFLSPNFWQLLEDFLHLFSLAKLLQALGRFSAKRAWLVVISWFLILASAGTWAVLGMGKLSSSMSIDGVPAQTVIDQLQKSFPEAARGSGSVVFHKPDGKPFTYEQKTAIAEILDHIKTMEAVADTVDPFELAVTKADAEAKIADGKVQIADAKAEIAANEKKLKDGTAELVSAKSQLDSAWYQLKGAKAQLASGKADYETAKANLPAAQMGVQFLLAQEGPTGANYLAAVALVAQMEGGIAQYEAGTTAYNTGKAQYDAGLAKYRSGAAALADGKKQLATARSSSPRRNRNSSSETVCSKFPKTSGCSLKTKPQLLLRFSSPSLVPN